MNTPPHPDASRPHRSWERVSGHDLRADWLINPDARRRARRWCTFLGFWGVLSGYACFLLWWEHTHEPWKLAVAFAFSLGAALVIEFARDLLRHGEIEELRKPSAGKVLAIFLTAAVFELFVLAFHGVSELNEEHAAKLRADILGPALERQEGVIRDLATLAVLWIVVGATVAWVLASVVFSLRRRRLWPTAWGSAVGALAGVIAAPAAVFAYMFAIRTGLAVPLLLKHPDEWRAHLQALFPDPAHSGGLADAVLTGALIVIDLLSRLVQLGFRGAVVAALLLAGLVLVGVRRDEWRPLALLLFGVVVAIAAPLADALDRVFLLGLLAAAVWFLPGALLGFSAPLLERPSERPTIWIWAGLGFLAALVLAALTIVQSYNRLLLVVAAALAIGGVAFYRGARIEEYWPLVALSIAVLVWGLALGFKNRELAPTSYAVLDYLHQVNMLPPSVAKVPPVSDPTRVDTIFRREKAPTLSDGLGGLERLPLSKQVTELGVQRARLDGPGVERYERLKTLVAGKIGRVTAKSPTARPATGEALSAACRDGVRLACLDQIRRDRWNSLSIDIEAEIAEAIDRVGREGDPHTRQSWQVYASALILTRGDLAALERANRELEAAIGTRKAALAKAEADRVVRKKWAGETYVPQQLELSIAGAFAFWVTVGLLVAWSIRRNALIVADTDRVSRCFWAAGSHLSPEARDALRRYHDGEHGQSPHSDRELLERLALDMLLDNRNWEKREWLRQRFAGLPPDELVAMSAESARGLAGDPAEREVLGSPAAIEMVLDNAKRLQVLYRETAPGAPTGSARLLLDDWQARAQEVGAGLIDHVRDTLRLPPGARVGTLLQSVGLAGPAHFEGCVCRPRPHEAPVESQS